MGGRRSGFWLVSDITGTYHYHNLSPHGHTDKYVSKCSVHKISHFHFVDKKRFPLEKISTPEKICKVCLVRLKLKFDIFNYIDDIEETVEEVKQHVDFICKIPDIELYVVR